MRSTIQLALAGATFFSSSLATPILVGGYQKAEEATTSVAPSSTVIPYLNNGFPDFSPSQLQTVEVTAHGTLPNGAPPPKLSNQGAINLQLIEFNENFEVAFFSSLLHNITTSVSGFEIKDAKQKAFIVEAITAVLAQEELHAANARGALAHFGHQTINPCPSYMFPTTTFEDAIGLAKTFTDVVLGTLQDVIVIFAENNDDALTGAVASVVGQEGEQNGFYRILQNQNLIPSALPFLTTSTRDFAFSALQGFVNGACPGTDVLVANGLKIFGGLNLLIPKVAANDQLLTFSFDVASLTAARNLNFTQILSTSPYLAEFFVIHPNGLGAVDQLDWSKSGVYLQYINQQNTPIGVPLLNIKVTGTVVTFQANFPYTENLLNSLTIAAVTVGNNFASANEVAAHALFAPALIEVD